nr:alanine:cation symporter family protein [Wolbachia endosymbiont of Mansonella ozzardi]
MPLFSKLVLSLIMFSFAFSTIIAYCYYCEVALLYLFGSKKVLILFQVLISGFGVYQLYVKKYRIYVLFRRQFVYVSYDAKCCCNISTKKGSLKHNKLLLQF